MVQKNMIQKKMAQKKMVQEKRFFKKVFLRVFLKVFLKAFLMVFLKVFLMVFLMVFLIFYGSKDMEELWTLPDGRKHQNRTGNLKLEPIGTGNDKHIESRLNIIGSAQSADRSESFAFSLISISYFFVR